MKEKPDTHRERVTASFAVVGSITGEQRERFEELLNALPDVEDAEVTLWYRQPGKAHKSDGVNVAATVEAEDEFEANILFANAVRAALDAVGWRLQVARLETECVRVVEGYHPLYAVPAQRALAVPIEEMGYEGAVA